MDLIPHDLGGDDFYLNGSYNKLQNAGAAYGLDGGDGTAEQADEPEEESPDENTKEETDDRFLRKKRRTQKRNGGM